MKRITRMPQCSTLLLVSGLFMFCVPVQSATSPAGTTEVSAAHSQDLLRAHNRWRAKVGVPNLTWSNTLAAGAQEWANKLAASGTLQHDASSGFGENLSISSGPQTPTEAVDNWGSEKTKCNYKGEPIGTQTCVVGHYTQIVWRNSTELGCGVARAADGATFWVCRYNPAGNMMGEKPY